jgi:hypothetical protein
MKRLLIALAMCIMLFVTLGASAEGATSCRTGCVTVKGYVKSNGTYVAAHNRNYPVVVYSHSNGSTYGRAQVVRVSKAGRYFYHSACRCWTLRFRVTSLQGADTPVDGLPSVGAMVQQAITTTMAQATAPVSQPVTQPTPVPVAPVVPDPPIVRWTHEREDRAACQQAASDYAVWQKAEVLKKYGIKPDSAYVDIQGDARTEWYAFEVAGQRDYSRCWDDRTPRIEVNELLAKYGKEPASN